MTKRFRYLPVALTAVAIFAACDVTDSERFLAPDADLVTGSASDVARTSSAQQGNKTYGLISSSGGTLAIGGHSLVVPAGAVDQPTWFTLQIVEANAVHVRLKAWRASDGAPVTQFPNVPVRLKLDASRLDMLDPSGLVIVYLRDGTYWGAREKVVSAVDTSTWTVTGYLTHFSQYALFRELAPGID
jgi:hypothetical protein